MLIWKVKPQLEVIGRIMIDVIMQPSNVSLHLNLERDSIRHIEFH